MIPGAQVLGALGHDAVQLGALEFRLDRGCDHVCRLGLHGQDIVHVEIKAPGPQAVRCLGVNQLRADAQRPS
jgi:hypothetical protein